KPDCNTYTTYMRSADCEPVRPAEPAGTAHSGDQRVNVEDLRSTVIPGHCRSTASTTTTWSISGPTQPRPCAPTWPRAEPSRPDVPNRPIPPNSRGAWDSAEL